MQWWRPENQTTRTCTYMFRWVCLQPHLSSWLSHACSSTHFGTIICSINIVCHSVATSSVAHWLLHPLVLPLSSLLGLAPVSSYPRLALGPLTWQWLASVVCLMFIVGDGQCQLRPWTCFWQWLCEMWPSDPVTFWLLWPQISQFCLYSSIKIYSIP